MRFRGVLGQVEGDTGDVGPEVGESGLGRGTSPPLLTDSKYVVKRYWCMFLLVSGMILTYFDQRSSKSVVDNYHTSSILFSLSLSLSEHKPHLPLQFIIFQHTSKWLVVDAKEIWRCTGHSWTIKFWLFQQGLRRKPWPIHSFSHLPGHPGAVVSGRFSSNKHEWYRHRTLHFKTRRLFQHVSTNCFKTQRSWKHLSYPKQLHGKKKTQKINMFHWKTVPTNQDTLDSWVASYVVMLHHFVPT